MKKVNSLYVFPESGSFDKKYSTDSYTVRHLTIHPNVVYYIQFANQITIMAVAHEKQSPQTVSSMITRFIEHHTKQCHLTERSHLWIIIVVGKSVFICEICGTSTER